MKHSRPRNIRLILLVSLIFCVILCQWFNQELTIAILTSVIRQSTPLVLGALCGIIGERAGVINIGVEGQMLFSAFVGFWVASISGNLYGGVIAGIAAGMLMGGFLGFMALSLHMDQIIAGAVINVAAIGVTGYFYPTGRALPEKLLSLHLPVLSDTPFIGPLFFNHPPITLVSMILCLLVHLLLFHSTWGLHTRAAGEHPRAADTMGLNVIWIRHSRLMIGGGLAGLAGLFLSLEAVGAFERNMVNGRGFIALAVMIFGRWRPLGAWGAALFFSFVSVLQTQLQFSGFSTIPHQFTGMSPYLLTVIVIALFMKRNRPPEALGIPYKRA